MQGGLEQVSHPIYGKCYQLKKSEDIALSTIMQGALVNRTTLPSGTKTPSKDLIVKGIYLCQKTEVVKYQTEEEKGKEKKVFRILARTQWSSTPSDCDQFVEAQNENDAKEKFKPMGTVKVIHEVILTNLQSAKQMKAYRMQIGLGATKMRQQIMFGIDGPSISSEVFAKQKLHAHVIQYLGPVLRNF